MEVRKNVMSEYLGMQNSSYGPMVLENGSEVLPMCLLSGFHSE